MRFSGRLPRILDRGPNTIEARSGLESCPYHVAAVQPCYSPPPAWLREATERCVLWILRSLIEPCPTRIALELLCSTGPWTRRAPSTLRASSSRRPSPRFLAVRSSSAWISSHGSF